MNKPSLLTWGIILLSCAGVGAFFLWRFLIEDSRVSTLGSAVIAVDGSTQNLPEIFSVLDGNSAYDCRGGECVQQTEETAVSWWKKIEGWWSREESPKARAQDQEIPFFAGSYLRFPSNAIVITGNNANVIPPQAGTRDDQRNTLVLPSPATFSFGFQINEPTTYTAFASFQNADSNDIISAVRCNGANEAVCVPDSARSFLFSSITLKKDNLTLRELGGGAIPARSSPQTWQTSLGLLNPGQYSLEFVWSNDFEKVVNQNGNSITYRLSLLVNGLVVSPPTSIAGETPAVPAEDIIGIRAYSNPEYLTLLEWYQKNVPNSGNPTVTTINGFPALIDQGNYYIMGFNIVERSRLESWGLNVSSPSPGLGNLGAPSSQ